MVALSAKSFNQINRGSDILLNGIKKEAVSFNNLRQPPALIFIVRFVLFVSV